MSIPLHRKRQLCYFPLQQKPSQHQYNCPRSISRHKIKRNFGAESLGKIPKHNNLCKTKTTKPYSILFYSICFTNLKVCQFKCQRVVQYLKALSILFEAFFPYRVWSECIIYSHERGFNHTLYRQYSRDLSSITFSYLYLTCPQTSYFPLEVQSSARMEMGLAE